MFRVDATQGQLDAIKAKWRGWQLSDEQQKLAAEYEALQAEANRAYVAKLEAAMSQCLADMRREAAARRIAA